MRVAFCCRAENATSWKRLRSKPEVSSNHATDQDVADVQRVVAGDVSAFEGIVQRWQQRIVSLAWRFCRDRAMAEDMAQEVFIKVYRSLESFRGESTFSTWLTSIALNTCPVASAHGHKQTVSLDPARAVATGAARSRACEDRAARRSSAASRAYASGAVSRCDPDVLL